jgi:hypothetical protein
MNARFGPPLTDSPIGELTRLRRMGSVNAFSKRFITFACHDTSLSEHQQIQLFITGLGDPLRIDVALQQLVTLDDAVIFTHAYEQCNTPREATTVQLSHFVSHWVPRSGPQQRLGPMLPHRRRLRRPSQNWHRVHSVCHPRRSHSTATMTNVSTAMNSYVEVC